MSAGAVAVRARRERARSATASRWLDLSFLSVVLVMAAHEAEHVAQVIQKDALQNSCPVDCRGLLGFKADVEWVHFTYNHAILIALAAIYVGFGLWRRQWRERNPPAWWALTIGIFGVQGYHAVEHAVKLEQWLTRGHMSPQPGILGTHFSLIELHMLINSVVFVLVLWGYFGLGFHRRALRRWATVVLPAALVALLVVPTAVAVATRTPVQRLEAGVHEGPLVLDSRVKLEGEPGAVVRGGIHVKAGGVQIRDVTVVGGEVGILVEQAKNVLIERVAIRNATLDGIHATRSSVTVRDCTILSPPGAHGIELSFASSVGMNSVTRCTVDGGAVGIVSHLAMASFRDNTVRGTSLHGISLTEMSMGEAVDNTVLDGKGVGLYCGDYSHCDFTGNTVSGTTSAGDGRRTTTGYGIQSHFWAKATLDGNRLVGNAKPTGTFVHARLVHED